MDQVINHTAGPVTDRVIDQAGKTEIVKKALTAGIINDPRWLYRLDEPMPAWAVIDMLVKLLEKLDPPYETYD